MGNTFIHNNTEDTDFGAHFGISQSESTEWLSLVLLDCQLFPAHFHSNPLLKGKSGLPQSFFEKVQLVCKNQKNRTTLEKYCDLFIIIIIKENIGINICWRGPVRGPRVNSWMRCRWNFRKRKMEPNPMRATWWNLEYETSGTPLKKRVWVSVPVLPRALLFVFLPLAFPYKILSFAFSRLIFLSFTHGLAA